MSTAKKEVLSAEYSVSFTGIGLESRQAFDGSLIIITAPMSWVLLGAGMKNSLGRFRRNEADSHGRGPVTDCLMHADEMLMGKLHVETQWWIALLKTANTLPTHTPTPIDSDSTQLGTLPDVSTLLKS